MRRSALATNTVNARSHAGALWGAHRYGGCDHSALITGRQIANGSIIGLAVSDTGQGDGLSATVPVGGREVLVLDGVVTLAGAGTVTYSCNKTSAADSGGGGARLWAIQVGSFAAGASTTSNSNALGN